MLVIKIISVLACVILVIYSILRINSWTEIKYEHRFFTFGVFATMAVSALCISAGVEWARKAELSGGDVLNGWALVSLGAAIVSWLFYKNVQQCGLKAGIIGSTAQLVVVMPAAFFGFMAVIAFFVTLLLISSIFRTSLR